MAERVSTLTLQLIDDISKPARSVEQAMADAKLHAEAARATAAEKALAQQIEALHGELAALRQTLQAAQSQVAQLQHDRLARQRRSLMGAPPATAPP